MENPIGYALAPAVVAGAVGLLALWLGRGVDARWQAVIALAFASPAAGFTAWAVARRVRAGELARRAEAFRGKADSLDVGVCVLGADGRWAWANQCLADLLGVSREHLVGSSPLEFLDDDNRAILTSALERGRQGDPSSYELAVIPAAGRRRVLRVRPLPLVGEALGIGGSLSIVEEAAEGAGERASAPEHLLRTLLDQAPAGAALIEGGRIAVASPGFAETSGYALDKLADRDALEIIHPVDHGRVEDTWRRATADDARGASIEFRMIRQDGSIGWIRDVTLPIAWHGRPATLHFWTDISREHAEEEHRAARERRLRSMFDHAPAMLVLLDGDGTIADASLRWLQLVGRDRDEVTGRPLESVMDEQSAQAWTGRIVRDLRDAGSIEGVRFRVVSRDGAGIDVRVAGVMEPRRGNRQPGMLLAFERSEGSPMLEGQARRAQRLEALGTLAGGIAHDFNNIIFAILGYADMALDSVPEGERLRGDLEQIVRAARRAQELVKQIVTFAREGEGQARPLDPRPVVRESLKLLQSIAPATVRFREKVDRDLPHVLADPAALHQVLVNLVTNGIEAMDEQGELTVHLDSLTKDGRRVVRMAVEDTGPGVPPGMVEQIFEQHFTTKHDGSGSGLGLAVVRSIVSELGGSIEVANRPEGGARFEVFLPSIEVPRAGDAAPADRLAGRTGEQGGHALVVDDEEALVEMLSTMLRSAGYTVASFTEPERALVEFRRNPDRWDLVITDQTMPGMTGDELARELLALRRDLPIVLCTGFSEKVDEDQALALGIRAFLMKPFTLADLLDKIASLGDKDAAEVSS